MERPEELKAQIHLIHTSFDWAKTDVFKAASSLPRYCIKIPRDGTYAKALHYYKEITNRVPDFYGKSDALQPILSFSLSTLYDLLVMEMGMPAMYYKIKKHVRELNYETTLDVVKRTLITCQMKEDAKTLIVKYYDCRELFITVN